MTRINVVDPSLLSSKHLIAEYRELPRVFGLVAKAVARGEQPNDPRNPAHYVLGTGHVRFFYPRLGYLRDRFDAIVLELRARGVRVAFGGIPDVAMFIPKEWHGSYSPTPEAVHANVERIIQRGGLKADPLFQRQL